MVTIINYKKRTKEDGSQFCVLELGSGIELIKSESTGQYYATTKKCTIPATFDEVVCKTLIGTTLGGEIVKVDCAPYQYTVQETGELVTLTHRYQYVSENEQDTPSHEEMKDRLIKIIEKVSAENKIPAAAFNEIFSNKEKTAKIFNLMRFGEDGERKRTLRR